MALTKHPHTPPSGRHSSASAQIVAEIIETAIGKKDASRYILKWTRENIPPRDQSRFVEVFETELLSLHEGNFARYRVRPSQLAAWQSVWTKRSR
jgi:hypothetical protein